MKNVASVLLGVALVATTLGAMKKNGRIFSFGVGCAFVGGALLFVR